MGLGELAAENDLCRSMMCGVLSGGGDDSRLVACSC